MGSKLLKSLMSVVLVIGLMPTLALADDATTANEVSGSQDAAVKSGGSGETDVQTVAEQAMPSEQNGESDSVALLVDSGKEDTRPALQLGEDDVFKTYIQNTELVATLTKDGTLTITGSGAMPNWQNTSSDKTVATHTSARPWSQSSVAGNVKKIVIGSGITRIGDLSFWGTCSKVSQIILPDSLKEIGFAAFSQQNPKTVIIPNGVKIDRGWSFGDQTQNIVFLGSCDISSTTHVQYDSDGITGYTAMVAGDNTAMVSALESGKDKTCKAVDKYELLGSCGGEEGFSSSVYYTYKDGALTISGSGSMRDYSVDDPAPWAGEEVKTVAVEDGVTSIGANAFANNASLESVSISTSVVNLGEKAFDTESCTVAGTVFAVAEDSAAEKWLKDNGINPDPTLDEYGRPRLTADVNAGELYKEYIRSSKTIATFTNDGTLTISGSGPMPDFENTELNERPWQKYNDKVKRIVIGNGVTRVGKISFYLCCSNVEEILIADSVRDIGHAAFSWQQKLASIAVPENLAITSSWAFAPSLKDIYFLGASNLTNKLNVLYNYNQSPSYTAHVFEGSKTASSVAGDETAGSVKTYGADEMGACGVAPYSSSAYYAYDSVTKTLNIMGMQAMQDYSEDNPAPWVNLDVQNVVISEGVRHIGAHAFCGNNGIKYVSVASSATTVGEHAFSTDNLSDVYFMCSTGSQMSGWLSQYGKEPAVSAGSCGESATWQLRGSTLTISGTGAMRDYSMDDSSPWYVLAASIKSVKIGSGISSLGNYAFADLTNVTTVSVPASVSKIGDKAFAGCSALSSIRLPENVTEVSGDSFEDCATELAVSGYKTTEAAFAGKLSQGKTTIKVTVPARLKVLFVGNSFSQNAVSQLDQIAKSAGAEETLIANLHQSAHPVSGYVKNITSKENQYQYTERGTLADTTHNTSACNLDYGLTAQDWDVIVIQPYCWQSYSATDGPDGEQFKSASNYADIATLANYAKATTTNPKAKLAFYQIWSRPFDYLKFNNASDHVWNGGYIDGLSSQYVWQQIVRAYDYSEGTSPFDYYVPVGTAIENARLTFLEETPMKDTLTSYKNAVGSGLNSDNIHLNSWGSFIDGMAFVKALTGLSIDGVTYKPTGMTDSELAMAKIAVNAAFEGPSKNAQGNVNALTYAKIGDVSYSTLAEAVAAAKSGDTVEIFGMPKSDSDVAIAAGVTVKTYGSEANHEIALNSGGLITASGLTANGGATIDGVASVAPVNVDAVTGATAIQNVAEWNGREYPSVQAAINAAAAGSGVTYAVKLLCNVAEPVTIAENTNISFDLNGFTLSNSTVEQKAASGVTYSHTIKNNGYLEIRDSSENHTGAVDNVSHGVGALYNSAGATAYIHGGKFLRSRENGTSKVENGGNSWYTIKNYGSMTIDGENVSVIQGENGVGGYSSLIANGWQGVSGEPAATSSGAVLTINDGTFSGGLNTVKNDVNGHLFIKGGIFKNQKQAALLNWNVAEISGGNFQVSDKASYIILNSRDKDDPTTAAGELTITDGVFGNASGSNVKLIEQFGGAYPFGTAKVSGGSFVGQFPSNLPTGDDGLTVSGGTFSNSTFEKYCEEGYAPTFNEETGTYSPSIAKSWTDKVESFDKDSAPDATDLGYTRDEAANLAFAGWYESDADGAAACDVNASGKAYAKFVPITDIIKFRGGALRMDGAADVMTSLRFGYQTRVPDGSKLNGVMWKYKLYGGSGKIYEKKMTNYYAWEDGTIDANFVIPEILPSEYRNGYCVQEHVEYVTSDGTAVSIAENGSIDGFQKRSVFDVATDITNHNKAPEVDRAYAGEILKNIPDEG